MVAFKLLTVLALALEPVAAIWPAPSTMTTGTKDLFINSGVRITYNGEKIKYQSNYNPSPINSETIVQGGVSRSLGNIFNTGLYPWMFHPRNETSTFEPSTKGVTYVSSLAITQTGKDNSSTFKPLAGQVDESYDLTISTGGEATIKAVSSIGVLRGLETFSQLFYTHSTKGYYYTPYAPVSITDAPQFPHRGIMMDTARNYYSVATILRQIDACAWAKLNILHIHATDSQSWPLEIPALPDISSKGAYRSDMVYTPADVQQIMEYGVARGVQVVIEIDQPGHIASLGWSYPELLTAYNIDPYTEYCAEPPCGQLKLNDSANVDPFMDKLMADLLPRLYPYAAYFHTGGDELNANDSAIDPTVGTNDTSVIQPLIQSYTDKSHTRVRNAGMTPMVWEEIPLDWNVTLGDDVVVNTWLGPSSIKTLTGMGHKVIDANWNYLYLDCGRGQWVTFNTGPTFDSAIPFNDWCGPSKNWELIYSYDPLDTLTSAEAEYMLGAEVAIWSETIDEVTIDTLAWPRAAVMGEVLWSNNIATRNQNEAAPRLNLLREFFIARGVNAASVQMPFCTEGGNCEQPYVPYP